MMYVRTAKEQGPNLHNENLIAGKYKISRRLGTGGHAIVYFGIDVSQKTPVAVKQLQLDGHLKPAEREGLIQRFYQEAEIAQGLTHPNIVTVFDCFHFQDQHMMILEYVDGLPLDQYIEEQKPSFRQLLDLLIQTAEALSYAHRKNIIHRDIKPQNILISSDQQTKLMDFGIAKQSENNSNTSDGSFLGTLAYMSPEQLQNSKNVTALCDIYSFGVMMYELFSGRLPFECESLAELVTAIFCQIPLLLHERNPHIPPELSAVISQAMGRDPSQRYADMKSLRSDLVRCMAMISPAILKTPMSEIRLDPTPKEEPIAPPQLNSKKKQDKPTPFYQKYLATESGDQEELGDWFSS